ncbi:hypothetical protein [Undibacterium sp. Tian12W]|uniref:hypothetical protein n=1 Tax=Undibacterium sp. Tian12W TaxID=3413054 RepID=UPI003BF3543E
MIDAKTMMICEMCGKYSPSDSIVCIECACPFSASEDLLTHREDSSVNIVKLEPQLQVGLNDFLCAANFGGVRIGMNKTEVLALAGPPAVFGDGTCLEDAACWINGICTFWFSGATLERIGIYFTLDYASNNAIQYDSDFPRHRCQYREATQYMEREKILFSHDVKKRAIISGGGVYIYYRNDGEISSMVFPAVR